MEQRSNKMEQKFEPMLVPENSDIFTKTLIPPIVDQNEKNAFNAKQRKVRCGIRNKVRYLYNLKIIRIDTIDIFIRYTLSITIRSCSFFDFFRSNKTSDNSSRETLDHRAFFFFFSNGRTLNPSSFFVNRANFLRSLSSSQKWNEARFSRPSQIHRWKKISWMECGSDRSNVGENTYFHTHFFSSSFVFVTYTNPIAKEGDNETIIRI